MRIRLVIGVLLVLVGLVWLGQGTGHISGSFMTGDPTWTVIGALTTLIGLALMEWGRRERSAG